ncbi:MAG TPA: DUF885 domain-containing protein [Candidatus Polarisedimenticolia bacterium]|nr:DUF885 domain-containing protein [Candidatus Polarisedimenticolia bacterium]
MKYFLFLTLLLGASLSRAQKNASPAPSPRTVDLATLYDRYFDECYFKFNPTQGTAAGFHKYDNQLEDYSRAALDKQIVVLKKFRDEFSKGYTQLGGDSYATIIDHTLVLNDINARLLTLENIRPWEKNPDQYSSGITNSIFVIMARTFAPPADRLKAVIAREKQVPAVFQAARQNLKNPPPIYVDVALEQIPGIISFFQKDVPEAFKDVKDQALLAQFQTANQKVMDELKSYGQWMEKELKPQAHGDFRIGADNYGKKLLYDEDVDIPLARLLEIGMANLRLNQQAFKDTAAKVDPSKTPREILAELEKDHPAPDKLLQTFRDTLGGLKDFLSQHHIVKLPSEVLPIVEETPPFARALTFASMDTPGPFEKVAKEAFFNVTLPEPTWKPEQVEEHMAGFNRGTIISTAVHEVYPGHYTQFLWVPYAPSKVRKLLGCSSNAEGWAHYSEQMMLDEGYGRTPGVDQDHDTAFLKLRLGQLQDALLRNARFIVGIQMHTGTMTFDQGVAFFEKEGYQSHMNGLRETKRGTSDPTYLYYTLGKLEILKLREDYKKKMGAAFSLERFHNELLQQGFPPIKLLRQTMLGDNSPVL